jgi:hypothetical protein
MSSMPAAAITSASPIFWQVMPLAPAATCSFASSGLLCVLMCGRLATPAASHWAWMRAMLGREPFGRLVDQDHFGIGHQRPADGQHLLFAAGELVAPVRAALAQARKDFVDAVQRPVAARRCAGAFGDEIFLDARLGRRCRAPPARSRGRRAR